MTQIKKIRCLLEGCECLATFKKLFTKIMIDHICIGMDGWLVDKLMYIPNDDTQIYPFCRLQ